MVLLYEMEPWGYHLTNLLLHTLNGAVLYIFLTLHLKHTRAADSLRIFCDDDKKKHLLERQLFIMVGYCKEDA